MIGGAVVRQRQMCCQDAKDQESILDLEVATSQQLTLVVNMLFTRAYEGRSNLKIDCH